MSSRIARQSAKVGHRLDEAILVARRAGKDLEENIAPVVVADGDHQRRQERVEQVFQAQIGGLVGVVRQVAHDDHGVCVRVIAVDMRDAGGKPLMGIDPDDGGTVRNHVQVGEDDQLGHEGTGKIEARLQVCLVAFRNLKPSRCRSPLPASST